MGTRVALMLRLSALVPLSLLRFQNLRVHSLCGRPCSVIARLECIKMPQTVWRATRPMRPTAPTRVLRLGADIGLRPIPDFDLVGRVVFDRLVFGQGVEMAVDEQRAIAEVDLWRILAEGFRKRLHFAADLDLSLGAARWG